jgi:hypothetical protein
VYPDAVNNSGLGSLMVVVVLAITLPVACCCVSYRVLRYLNHREPVGVVPAGGLLVHAPSRLERLLGRTSAPIIAFESPPHSPESILQPGAPEGEEVRAGPSAIKSKSPMDFAAEERAAQRRAQRRAYVLEASSREIHPAGDAAPMPPTATLPPMDAAAPGETLQLGNYVDDA